uniref:Uncharacterized protein n=1 Tax=Arundo donax TaxID=35708 RepID=A0A0A8Y0Q6_ARUDO
MPIARPHQNADVHRLWAKYFAPAGTADGLIQVPMNWASFFTAMLLSPAHIDWAKQFLVSRAWEIISTVSADFLQSILFASCYMPKK